MKAEHVGGFLQLAETLRELGFFRLQLLTEREIYVFVKRPEVIYGHGF